MNVVMSVQYNACVLGIGVVLSHHGWKVLHTIILTCKEKLPGSRFPFPHLPRTRISSKDVWMNIVMNW